MADRKRFRGFISYSQQDMIAARRLHSWLENYRVPLGLVADIADTRKLGRFFRDEEEMSAAADIGASVRGAIEEAESLIVICSPRSAQSKWVNAEIQHFRRTGRGGKVFAVIIDGVPNSGSPETECFPAALRAGAPADDPDGMPLEPLGLDLRKEGRARACARLAAGLLSIEFDALWQREKRRQTMRLAAAGAAAAVVLAIGAAFIIPAQLDAENARQSAASAEQRRALSERDADLARIVQDLGQGDAEAGFRRLADLYQRLPDDGSVLDAALLVLSWARTPQESILDAAASGVFWTGADYMARAPGGKTYPLSVDRPIRSIGLSGERALLVFQDRIVVANERTGQTLGVLREADVNEFRRFDWNGYAIEAPTGDALLTGHHSGVSNGSSYPAILTVSGHDNAIGITLPMHHPRANGDTWISRGEGQSTVTAGCTIFGLEADTRQYPSYEGAYFTYQFQGGLQPLNFERIDQGYRFYPSDSGSGCTPLRYDGSIGPAQDARTRLGGQVIGVRLSDSPPPVSAWTGERSTGKNTGRYGHALEWDDRPTRVDTANPCMAGECPAIPLGDFDDATFGEPADSGTSGWVVNAPPAGQPPGVPGQLGEPLYTYFSQDNHSFVGAWCRNLGPETRCFYHRRYFEQSGDMKLLDARSASGRYLAYAPTPPLRIMDLVDMRNVSPSVRELPAESELLDFDRNGPERLFAVADKQLEILEPDASGRFESIGSTLAWPRDLSAYGPLARLVSMPGDDVLVVTKAGRIIRLDWRTGQVRWTSGAPGLDDIRALRLSPNATWLAAFGRSGARLLRTSDGLLASGILHPPETLQPNFERGACGEYGGAWHATDLLSDAAVSDDGMLSVWCGGEGARYSLTLFTGDPGARFNGLLAPSVPQSAGH